MKHQNETQSLLQVTDPSFSSSCQKLPHASPFTAAPRGGRGGGGGKKGIVFLCLRAEADDRRGPSREHDFLAYQSAYRIGRRRRRWHRFVLCRVAVITVLHVDVLVPVPVSVRITSQRRWRWRAHALQHGQRLGQADDLSL